MGTIYTGKFMIWFFIVYGIIGFVFAMVALFSQIKNGDSLGWCMAVPPMVFLLWPMVILMFFDETKDWL